MGQRSQIYLRVTDKEGKVNLIANYYQWNYGERMVSRASGVLQHLQGAMNSFPDGIPYELKRYQRLMDVNFDMLDITLSSDIIDEYLTYADPQVRDSKGFSDWVFIGQDNNDGKLFIDCNIKESSLTYCFTDDDITQIMNAEEYLDWDAGGSWRHNDYIYNRSPLSQRDEMIKEWENTIRYTDENIGHISKVQLMDEKELENFIDMDYVKELPQLAHLREKDSRERD